MSVILFIYLLATFFSFFVAGCLLGAVFSQRFREMVVEAFTGRRDLLLARTVCNPILAPGAMPWTAEAVLNPAALALGGRTHLIYRAIGMDGVSRLGYASSPNGIVFDDQLPHPIYFAEKPRRVPGPARTYSPVMYPSGGSWGGCEDPRMVAIEGRVYLTYNAFDGWDYIRVALTSISEEDFRAKHWRWATPKLLSKAGERHKNWVLFPEKINGKFAILHSIVPTIEIEYRDSLEDVGTKEPFIKSWEGPREDVENNSSGWDHRIRSAGPPPIRTPQGWLVLYHATSRDEGHRYKLGAMLLDLDDPTKVLHRATAPVLSPDQPYENNGKPGIVYSCGAVVKGDMLYVYYGGADRVVCVATAALLPFLTALVHGERAVLSHISTRSR